MAKTKKQPAKAPKRLILPNDEPVKLNMTFEQAIKLAAKTPYKKNKIK